MNQEFKIIIKSNKRRFHMLLHPSITPTHTICDKNKTKTYKLQVIINEL